MLWNDIVAHQKVKEHLKKSLEENRISHAQLFIGKEGYGTMAMALAYAKEVICAKKQDCEKRISHLQHPDLHFSFPTVNIDKAKALSENYFQKFRDFLLENPYSDLEEWNNYLDVGNKQSVITVGEMERIIENLSLNDAESTNRILYANISDKLIVEDLTNFIVKVGILKRWTGETWDEVKLMVRIDNNWKTKKGRYYDGEEWIYLR